MRIDCVSYNNQTGIEVDNDKLKHEGRGNSNVYVITKGNNEPKDSCSIESKISRITVESFLKRPSIKDVALQNISKMANNAVMVEQSPNYKISCDFIMLAQVKDKIKWIRAGEISLMHFINGKLKSRTFNHKTEPLGTRMSVEPEISIEETLSSDEHIFIMGSDAFFDAVEDFSVEKAVRAASSSEQLIESLVSLWESKSNDSSKEISLMVTSLPPRKRKSKVILFIIIAVIIAALIFLAIGALGKMKLMGKGPRM